MVSLRLLLHPIKTGVVVGKLVQVGERDLSRDHGVIVGDIRQRIAETVLQLDVHSHPELLDVERH